MPVQEQFPFWVVLANAEPPTLVIEFPLGIKKNLVSVIGHLTASISILEQSCGSIFIFLGFVRTLKQHKITGVE